MAKRTKDEITAIAVANGYDGPAPKGTVEALNALAVALGYDGEYKRGKADAINAVGTVATGGGGGASLGALQYWPFNTSVVPVVGNMMAGQNLAAYEISVGNSVLFDGMSEMLDYPWTATLGCIAAGAKLMFSCQKSVASDIAAYVVTRSSQGKYATVAEATGVNFTVNDVPDNPEYAKVDFVVPALGEGEHLVIVQPSTD